ncbi:MAG: tetratricopeptide repeat protein [Candidatus Heimdallarchaeota archaeon]|nr:tetratricopeptide repeat protein [Candidatus Heimdallarchaeota archaeon]
MQLLEQVKLLMLHGKYIQARQILSSMTITTQVLILLSELDDKLSDYQQALLNGYESIHLSKRTGDIKVQIAAKYVVCQALWRLGKFEEALEILEDGEELIREFGEEYFDQQYLGKFYNIKGMIYLNLGDPDWALQNFLKSMYIFELQGDIRHIAESLNHIAIIYQYRGQLNEAMIYYQKSLELDEKIENEPEIASDLNNIGNILRIQGYYPEAMEYFNRSLIIHQKYLDKQEIASTLTNIGHLQYVQGKYDQAHSTFIEALNIRHMIGNDLKTADLLLLMIINSQEYCADPEEYMNELVILNEKSDNQFIEQNARIAEAVILKTGNRLRERVQAQQIFEYVLTMDILEVEKSLFIMINLCELLIEEMSITGGEIIFDEIISLTDQIYMTVESQNAYPMQIKCLILQSKLSLITNNVIESDYFLERAEQLANMHDLDLYKVEIAFHRNNLEKELSTWQEMIKSDAKKVNEELCEYLKMLEKTSVF